MSGFLGTFPNADNSSLPWHLTWATRCYYIWTWRNKEEHGEEANHPYDPGAFIFNKIKEYAAAMTLIQVGIDKTKITNIFSWSPPNSNWVKLNSNGACKNNQVACCGGVIMDENGRWLRGFSIFLGHCNIFMAEIWGSLEGLKLTLSLGYQKVELNVDSLMVVQAIDKGCSRTRESLAIISQIKQLMEKHDEVHVFHSFNEVNKFVDALASIGCISGPDILIYNSVSDYLLSLLDEDSRGVSYSRIMYV